VPKSSTAPALGTDESRSSFFRAQATKLPAAEVQSENKRNITGRGTKT